MFSALNAPIGTDPDPDDFIQEAMRWHFSEETGSPFWLRQAKELDFDPRSEVKSIEDLTLLPNLLGDLREVPVAELIPRGYQGNAEVLGIYESGGTTGAPKRVVCLRDWWQHVIAWLNMSMERHGFPRDTDWLGIMPTGPHLVAAMVIDMARARGSITLTVDMDPRWVKKLIAAGKNDQADAYADHLVEQAAFALRTQDIGVLMSTPALLERLTRNEELVELINEKVRAIVWGGTHMDADTRHLLRAEVFPETTLYGVYGSTMILHGAVERAGVSEDQPCIFDTQSPYVTFSVVDPDTRTPVEYGERGQVLMNHVSKGMLMPNNLERDSAIRIRPPAGQAGDSVGDVAPLSAFEDGTVIEGVY